VADEHDLVVGAGLLQRAPDAIGGAADVEDPDGGQMGGPDLFERLAAA
jgi:hypothetical protein